LTYLQEFFAGVPDRFEQSAPHRFNVVATGRSSHLGVLVSVIIPEGRGPPVFCPVQNAQNQTNPP
jgi:hypothetical protein